MCASPGASAAAHRARGPCVAASNAAAGGWRSPVPAPPSSTTAKRGRSSRRGRSGDAVTWRASPPSSSSPTLPRPAADVVAFVPGDRDRGLARGHVPAAALARSSPRPGRSRSPRFYAAGPGSPASATCTRAERRRECRARVLQPRELPAPHLSRRRRLHDGLDRDGVCDRAPSGGRPARRGRVLRASRAVVG